jgi:hemolysin activation/secretion protein
VNDRSTANTSDLRVSSTLAYGNLWNALHSLSLQYQTAPEEPEEAQILAATYMAPIPGTGHMLAAFAVDSNSEFSTFGADFASLGVRGDGQVYGLRYLIPLPQGERYSHSVTLGADYKDFNELITQPDGAPAATPISYVNWSTSYAGTYRTDRTVTGFDIGASFGVRGLANSSDEFHYKRYSGTPNKGDPGYWYLTANVNHERPLFWRLSTFLGVGGQYSPHALISNEQFSIGGADKVRGYFESEELGDYGAYGTFELRLPLVPAAWIAQQRMFYMLSFYDAGIVAIQFPLDQQQRKIDLASWGAGFRLSAFGLLAGLDWAYPLEGTSDTERGDSRIHFSVRYGF